MNRGGSTTKNIIFETGGNKNNLNNWHPNTDLNDIFDPDFNKFIENLLRHYPGYLTIMLSKYTNLSNHSSIIGKQENLIEDLSSILLNMKLIRSDQELHKMSNIKSNISPSYTIKWNEDLKEELLKTEYPFIKKYNY